MEQNSSYKDSWFVTSSIHPQFRSKLSPSADLAIATYLIFTGVSSVFGNGTVLVVYYRKRNKIKPAELMTVNLALCDFCFSLLGVPFFIISSLCHAWVFGETGCLWYGIQGSVFGIGSLITTSLISLDRCLKICCIRYGQWITNHHATVCIILIWLYIVFWASLPAFGFGSYKPEPYGTSCTVNWWSLRSSSSDRMYIYFFLTFGFVLPTVAIISSYLAILLKVYRSNRTLASIPCSTVSSTCKDLRLVKMAVVVCAAFLVAWLPYATVSFISVFFSRDDQESEVVSSPNILPSSLNWTNTESYNPSSGNWSIVTGPKTTIPPVVTLIPAMLAKSHCMMNPVIYQIMNREFRDSVYEMVFGRERVERRRQRRKSTSVQVRTTSFSDK